MTDRSDCEIDLKEQIHRLTKVTIETVEDDDPIVYSEGPFQQNKQQQMELCNRIGLWNVELESLVPVPVKNSAKVQICVGGNPICLFDKDLIVQAIPFVGSLSDPPFRVMNEEVYGKFDLRTESPMRTSQKSNPDILCFIGPFKSYDEYADLEFITEPYKMPLGYFRSMYPEVSVNIHHIRLPQDLVRGSIAACCPPSSSSKYQRQHGYKKKEWPLKSDA